MAERRQEGFSDENPSMDENPSSEGFSGLEPGFCEVRHG